MLVPCKVRSIFAGCMQISMKFSFPGPAFQPQYENPGVKTEQAGLFEHDYFLLFYHFQGDAGAAAIGGALSAEAEYAFSNSISKSQSLAVFVQP